MRERHTKVVGGQGERNKSSNKAFARLTIAKVYVIKGRGGKKNSTIIFSSEKLKTHPPTTRLHQSPGTL